MADPEAERLRVLVLANKPAGRSPSQRFRLEQWAPHLARDHGIDLELAPFESERLTEILYQPGHLFSKALLVMRDFVRRAKMLREARRYDAVVIHREAALIGPAIYERLIACSGVPVIFDFDDSIWMQQPEQKARIFAQLHFHRKTGSICALADAVSAGNDYLAAFARQRNSNVRVVPTTIELADYPPRPEPPGSPFIVCWTGSTTTLPHFEHSRQALEAAARTLPMVVKIIGNRPPDRPIAGAETRFVPWSAESEAREIADSHVGIMPLPDNEFSRGKCGLKALQYMAASRPTIASPVGVNRAIVRTGETGFLAATPNEFTEALLNLAASPELRAKLGNAARKLVEGHYSAEVGASRFAALVRSVV